MHLQKWSVIHKSSAMLFQVFFSFLQCHTCFACRRRTEPLLETFMAKSWPWQGTHRPQQKTSQPILYIAASMYLFAPQHLVHTVALCLEKNLFWYLLTRPLLHSCVAASDVCTLLLFQPPITCPICTSKISSSRHNCSLKPRSHLCALSLYKLSSE